MQAPSTTTPTIPALPECPANLVTNGGFESGLDGFTIVGESKRDVEGGSFDAYSTASTPFAAHSGQYSYVIGGTDTASLVQTLPNCMPVAATCTLAFYFMNWNAYAGTAGLSFSASIGGVTLLDSTVDPRLANPTGSNTGSASDFVRIASLPFVYMPGAMLNFTGANPRGSTGLDDVSIECPGVGPQVCNPLLLCVMNISQPTHIS